VAEFLLFQEFFASRGFTAIIVDPRELEYRDGTAADKKAINYEVFTTANGARYGVKLLVVFSVADPQLALTNFKPEDIVPHIENLVVTEMNKAIQATESTSFLQTRAGGRAVRQAEPSSNPSIPSAPIQYENPQDEIKDHLCRDLRDVGIEVDRVSIEESIPIDQAVIEQMANFAVRNKKITLEVALLERESQIAEKRAQQVALKNTVMKQNEYRLMVERAQAELEVARLQVEAQNLLLNAHLDRLQRLGNVINSSPGLLKLHLAQTIYGEDSILPTLKTAGAQVGVNTSAVVLRDFFSQTYIPNPANTLLNLNDDVNSVDISDSTAAAMDGDFDPITGQPVAGYGLSPAAAPTIKTTRQPSPRGK